MYLVICKNKHGLSVQDYKRCSADAELWADTCRNFRIEGNTYHVRKLNLSQIDLDKLMENDK